MLLFWWAWSLCVLFRSAGLGSPMAAGTDRLYRGLLSAARFFSKGWGPVDTYERFLDHRSVLFSREGCAEILRQHPQRVTVRKVKKLRDGDVYEGEFKSPLAAYLPGLLPEEAERARFELILPEKWRETDHNKPVYIHLAGTGDHSFWRRRIMTVLPTLRSAGIGAVSLENPLYGTRKPPEQKRSQVRYVSDLFVMGMAVILECMVIMHWLEGRGLGPVGLTGFSMGGHNSSLAAALWPKPVAVVPCLSWSSASSSFTEGLLSRAVCWDVLGAQLEECHSGRDERRRECFRRIEKLETATLDSLSTRRHATTSETFPQSNLWWLKNQGDRQPHTNKTLYFSFSDRETDEIEREMGEPLSRGSVITASFNGLSSLVHMFQQSVTGLAGRMRREEREEEEGRRKRRPAPTPELIETMRMVLDTWTHHLSFPVPLAPHLAHFVTAKQDGYIPRTHLPDVRSLWQGCEVDFVSGGHISMTITKQSAVQQVLKEAMQKACSYHQMN